MDCTTTGSTTHFSRLPSSLQKHSCEITTWPQGLTLVHFSAHPKPFLVTEATSSVHFSVQPETFLPIGPLNIAHKTCQRQAEK